MRCNGRKKYHNLQWPWSHLLRHRDTLSLSISWNHNQFFKLMNIFEIINNFQIHEHFYKVSNIFWIHEHFILFVSIYFKIVNVFLTIFLNRRTFLGWTNIILEIGGTILEIHKHFFDLTNIFWNAWSYFESANILWINKLFCKSQIVFKILGYFSIHIFFWISEIL